MFNILIAGDEDAWNQGVFEFPRERVAREYTEDSISERYRDLDPAVVEELITFPSLFCVEGDEIPSRIGRITSVKVKGRFVRIEFEIDESVEPIRAGLVAESSILLDLGHYELSRTHWAIKEGDLWDILKKKGITLPLSKPLYHLADSDVEGRPKVFVIHGHDDVTKYEMAAAIRQLGCKPIILHEQANGGLTIIEKIERYSDVGFGVALYTPCDIGGKRDAEINLTPRARQNVVFEHGYLMAKLGRNKVMAFVKGVIETPTDISGVIYIPLDASGNWITALRLEMEAAGYLEPGQAGHVVNPNRLLGNVK